MTTRSRWRWAYSCGLAISTAGVSIATAAISCFLVRACLSICCTSCLGLLSCELELCPLGPLRTPFQFLERRAQILLIQRTPNALFDRVVGGRDIAPHDR